METKLKQVDWAQGLKAMFGIDIYYASVMPRGETKAVVHISSKALDYTIFYTESNR